MKSAGFIENTLLFLVLGLTSLALPQITKSLPTYIASITHSPSSQIAGIPDGIPETGYAEEGELCFSTACNPSNDLVCSRNYSSDVCVKRNSLKGGSVCTVNEVGNQACGSGKCQDLKVNTLGVCAESTSEPNPGKLGGRCWATTDTKCDNDLICVPNPVFETGKCVSTPGGNVGEGGTCSDSAKCIAGLICSGVNAEGQHTCITPLSRALNERCAASAACQQPYVCGGINTSGQQSCAAIGTIPEGGKCLYTENLPYNVCQNGLQCIYDSNGSIGKCVKSSSGSNPPAATAPNPPTGTHASAYCNNGKIQADVSFTPSNNATSYKVLFSKTSSNLTSSTTPVNNAATITNLTANSTFYFNSTACIGSACTQDQGGSYSMPVGNPCATSGNNPPTNNGDSPLNPPVESNQCIGPNGKTDTAKYLEPRCGGVKFDATKATANNTTYCGKEYSDIYTCGGKEFVNTASIDACSKSPWCPTASSNDGNNSNQGYVAGALTVIPNGVQYTQIRVAWRNPDGTEKFISLPRNSSNIYGYSGPAKVGSFDMSAGVYNGSTLIKASTETCSSTGGTAPFDCKVTVTKDGTTIRNFKITLDGNTSTPDNSAQCVNSGGICRWTESCSTSTGETKIGSCANSVYPNAVCCSKPTTNTPPNNGGGGSNPPPASEDNPPTKGAGEACTAEGSICGGSGDNKCSPALGNSSLHCCRFTARWCGKLSKCVNAGTSEWNQCVQAPTNTPTPVPAGYIDRSTCNGEGSSENSHCNYLGRNSCCADHQMSNGIGSSASCQCRPNKGSKLSSAANTSSQSIASDLSECSKNTDCKPAGKNMCVLNSQNVGTCE